MSSEYEEFLGSLSGEFYSIYEEVLANRKNEDYEINPQQMRKLFDAFDFFRKIAAENDGTVDPPRLVPKEVSSGLTARFVLFYVGGNDIKRLSEIVGDMSAISIDSLVSGEIEISFTIPNVFRKKQNG